MRFRVRHLNFKDIFPRSDDFDVGHHITCIPIICSVRVSVVGVQSCDFARAEPLVGTKIRLVGVDDGDIDAVIVPKIDAGEGGVHPKVVETAVGYGSGFYYPNLLLTFPAVLILCGFHEIAAYEIFTTICTFFSGNMEASIFRDCDNT